jgi:hypothetical protein
MVLPSILGVAATCLHAATVATTFNQAPYKVCLYTAITNPVSSDKSKAVKTVTDIFTTIESFISIDGEQATLVHPTIESIFERLQQRDSILGILFF